jgi:hypothetical protein
MWTMRQGLGWVGRTMSRGGTTFDTPAANNAFAEVEPMQYLPLFLLFMAALIAAYFYLQRAKRRDVTTTTSADDVRTDTPPANDQ